ncbi:hypothetical protein [Paenirhodobacter enshiensis]|uniref:hypothetical protein n=1 Tax=Paenirhodobacter enshiensis TaxID=1105367 RepID=UPI003FA226E5
MRIIVPHAITDAQLIDSNVPEDDAPAWDAATAYVADNRVIRSHAIYQAAQATTGDDPATDTAETWWVKVSATNRWRAFDDVISGGVVTGAGATITYRIRLNKTLDSVAFFTMDATSVRVRARLSTSEADFFDVTTELAARDDVANFWSYCFDEFSFTPDLVLTDLNLPSGCDVYITIAAGSVAKVGEIIMGRVAKLGTTIVGTGLGIVDYSTKERDDWGGLYIVSKPVTSTVSFNVKLGTDTAAWVHKVVKSIASKVCVFAADAGADDFGTTVPGILRDYDLTLSAGRSEMKLEVESLA